MKQKLQFQHLETQLRGPVVELGQIELVVRGGAGLTSSSCPSKDAESLNSLIFAMESYACSWKTKLKVRNTYDLGGVVLDWEQGRLWRFSHREVDRSWKLS